mgnify:CR=1 FL=1
MRIAAVTLVLCCLLILGPLAHISSEVAAGDVPPVEVWVLDRSGSFNTTLRSTAFDAGEYRWVASIPGPPSTAERLREFPESSVWGVYLAELPSLEQVSALVDRLRPLKPRGILLPFLEKGEWLTPEVLAALLSLPDIEHVHIYFQRQEVPDWVLEQLSGLGALSSLYLDNCTRISVGAFRKLCEKRCTTLEALLLGTTAIPISELIPLKSLKRLTIDGDPRSTFALTGIGKLQSLESLQLRRGMIAGDGYAEVLALKGLHKLHLAWGADGAVPQDVIKGLAGLPAVRGGYMPVSGRRGATGLAAMA